MIYLKQQQKWRESMIANAGLKTKNKLDKPLDKMIKGKRKINRQSGEKDIATEIVTTFF